MMKIQFKNDAIKKLLEDNNALDREYGNGTFSKYEKFKERVIISENLAMLKIVNPGMNIEKLKGYKNTWSARLDKKNRINFIVDESKNWIEIDEIIIERVHKHKY